MPSQPSKNTFPTSFPPPLHLLFLSLFILAFFPNLFISLLKPVFYIPPLHLLSPFPTAATNTPASTSTSTSTPPTMTWFQRNIALPPRSRGSYLITDHIVSELPELRHYKTGLLNLFIQHTSCALSLNENWDDDVRADMSDALDRIAPEDRKGELYRHSAEGLDDMPAHIKSALIGASVTIPITNGRLATGTWQGIWYLEFRASKHSRKVVATIQGEKM
ncbi:secondary thiamine-phosphate synthase enzyme [Emergomyces pasteurianus Ep9510]|uniref:Secondary thiamine-phosphate synthase enzyme n=1 Tax=Emergomyces pasteurianus Ep9510 TaxID=1447872 RepID=A0A1J9Q491_9EURO|nr:secondary thiamine-phosphate synthase enzyme [Emergomyces pasteurianus Ep9510]